MLGRGFEVNLGIRVRLVFFRYVLFWLGVLLREVDFLVFIVFWLGMG